MRPPHALTISASDPTGASGIQADLKTFTALGVYGASVVTGIQGASRTESLPADLIAAQLRTVLEAARPDAVKVGEIGTAAHAAAIVETLQELRTTHIVVDAVMIDGDDVARTSAEAVAVLKTQLLPLAHVLVCNAMEAAHLLGQGPASDVDGLAAHAVALREQGPGAVLVTGARLGGEDAVDVIAHQGGVDILRGRRVASSGTRGAGATLSSAISAQYARLAEYDRAGELTDIGEKGAQDDDFTIIASAREFVASTLANAEEWELFATEGSARGPVNHLITLDAKR